MYQTYSNYCSPPWATPRLVVSAEEIKQSELWLPMDEIRPLFYRLFRRFLTFSPIFSSTPFANASCWFEIVASFPAWLAPFSNPARLFQQIIDDPIFRTRFIFWSFMPRRYYGSGSNRYPIQMKLATTWLQKRQGTTSRINCLDAVSGDGSSVYECAKILLETGYRAEDFRIEGWALDPIESWAAAHRKFYHDLERETIYRQQSNVIFDANAEHSLVFKNRNLLYPSQILTEQYALIFCNGLLGGPIVHEIHDIQRIITFLSQKLVSGGLLLIADHFHDGWKKRCTEENLRSLIVTCGLEPMMFGEGIAGIKKGHPKEKMPS